jgi:hypothetical protein
MDPQAIINSVVPYLDYLSAPIFIFCVLAVADLLVSFAVDLIRKVKSGYRVRA